MAEHGQAPSDNPNLDAALYHAQAGRPVFPCSPTDKRPAIPKAAGGSGFKDATTDEAQIRAWWARYPDAVPGMPTGARVGVWVLDVDDKPGKTGRETLARLVAAFGALPETVETITATGGSRLFFFGTRATGG
jgi:putative DNA primase/helicase